MKILLPGKVGGGVVKISSVFKQKIFSKGVMLQRTV
jgi:hypothetical protein